MKKVIKKINNPTALKSKKHVNNLKLTLGSRRDPLHFHCHLHPPNPILFGNGSRLPSKVI